MDLLKKLKYLGVCAGVGVICLSSTVFAANPEDVTITVVVDNTITVVETDAGHFGTNVVVQDLVGSATLVVSPAGVVTGFNPVPGGARFVSVSNAAWSEIGYTVAAVPLAVLNVTYGAVGGGAVSITCTFGCLGATGAFTLDTWTHTASVGSVGAIAGNNSTVTLDGAGAATIAVGASLRTIPSADAYQSGTYTGIFRITLSY